MLQVLSVLHVDMLQVLQVTSDMLRGGRLRGKCAFAGSCNLSVSQTKRAS